MYEPTKTDSCFFFMPMFTLRNKISFLWTGQQELKPQEDNEDTAFL